MGGIDDARIPGEQAGDRWRGRSRWSGWTRCRKAYRFAPEGGVGGEIAEGCHRGLLRAEGEVRGEQLFRARSDLDIGAIRVGRQVDDEPNVIADPSTVGAGGARGVGRPSDGVDQARSVEPYNRCQARIGGSRSIRESDHAIHRTRLRRRVELRGELRSLRRERQILPTRRTRHATLRLRLSGDQQTN